MSDFCQPQKMSTQGEGGQKKPKSFQCSLWTTPNDVEKQNLSFVPSRRDFMTNFFLNEKILNEKNIISLAWMLSSRAPEFQISWWRFYPDFIQIVSRFYPDFILILSWFYPDVLQTHFIQNVIQILC
jgi:hypothetical protein